MENVVEVKNLVKRYKESAIKGKLTATAGYCLKFCVEKSVVMHEFCCHKGRKSFVFQSFQAVIPPFQTVVVFNRF